MYADDTNLTVVQIALIESFSSDYEYDYEYEIRQAKRMLYAYAILY